jgi:hypothetical protein
MHRTGEHDETGEHNEDQGPEPPPPLPFLHTGVGSGTRRAQPPRAPAPGAAAEIARREREAYLQGRERTEQRSVVRGLVWLGLLALGVSLLWAGTDRAFYHGWWRQW